jgi:predicted MFS family arabinose efflux permease
MLTILAGDSPTAVTRRRASPALAFTGVTLSFLGLFLAAGAPSPLFRLEQQEWGFPVWLLTIAFAIYAIALLATLLVAGSLSDYTGRRPVLIGALGVEAAAMLIFLFAPNIGWVIAARTVQGIATGAGVSTFTAAAAEYAPARHKKLGVLAGSVAPAAGLGLGALIAGIVVQFTAAPSSIIFTFLAVFFVLGMIVVIASPETVARRGDALRSLTPHVSVPRLARSEFFASIPVHIATWMLGGLYLGLVPSIMHSVFDVGGGLVTGLAILALSGTGALAGFLFSSTPARSAVILGGSLTVTGTAVILFSIITAELPLFFVGSVIAGAGFGASFSGALRIIAPLAEARQHAELFAAIYLVSYLSFSLPVVVAGLLVSTAGITATVVVYGGTVITAALAGLIWQASRGWRAEKRSRPDWPHRTASPAHPQM